MRKFFVFLLCFFVLAGSCMFPAEAEDVFRSGYVCRDLAGELRWQANIEIRKKQGDVYVLVEKGEGLYSSFKGRISWVAEMEFESTEDNVRPLKLEKSVFDDEGNQLRLEKQDFDLDNSVVRCLHKDFPRKISRKKTFKFDKDIVNRLMLGLYIQKFIENGKTSKKVQMVSEEPGFYNVELSIVDKEEIEVNGQKRIAYKLCLDPKLGLLNFVKVFFPKAYAWHSANPKFEWIRYEGLEGNINSEEVEITVQDSP